MKINFPQLTAFTTNKIYFSIALDILLSDLEITIIIIITLFYAEFGLNFTNI